MISEKKECGGGGRLPKAVLPQGGSGRECAFDLSYYHTGPVHSAVLHGHV